MAQPQAVQKLETNRPTEEEREQALVEGLKARHNVTQVHKFTADTGHTVYVRMPPSATWRRFRAQMQEPKKREAAGEILIRSCLLHPEEAGFDAMLTERPGLLDTFASELCELAGLSREIEKKVL